MDIKENAKNIDVWTRGLFILIYGVIFYFLFALIWLVVIFQFLMKLITTELNEQLLDFSDSLNKYVSQILLYITFKSEERPFPFSPWPGSETKKSTRKKISKKKTTKKETIDSNESDEENK
ncbi:MAG: DUF4389 domain-containing protein [Proteobacteria bacterium]|nr:DUF4389 domain-containing protein [Pseudomonadota bacterium]NOG60295.1 DUF4389 domain-containing protein [Pseudomonadota bacterium]